MVSVVSFYAYAITLGTHLLRWPQLLTSINFYICTRGPDLSQPPVSGLIRLWGIYIWGFWKFQIVSFKPDTFFPHKLAPLRISINCKVKTPEVVVQWLRIRLPMQGTLVQSLGTKIPHATGKQPVLSNYWTLSPYSPCSATRETTSLRSLCARKLESSPCSPQWKPQSSNRDPVQPKKYIKI